MSNKIVDILDYANWAAADGGEQPWRFRILGETIEIVNVGGDENQSHALLAHGAAIENITTAAPLHGLVAEVRLFPPAIGRERLVARITFAPGRVLLSELLGAIKKRAVNRRPYYGSELSAEEEREVTVVAGDSIGLNVKLLKGGADKRLVADAVGLVEKLALAEAGRRSLWQHWKNCLGAINRAANRRIEVCLTSQALGAITMHRANERDWVEAGRAFQRLWLRVTALGLALEPISEILFLPRGNADVIQAVESVGRAFAVTNETVGVLFRLGRAPGCLPQPPRYPLDKLLMQ